jgi:hypothetical protein
MSRFFTWLKNWASAANDGRSRDRRNMLPSMEILEPRQMLATGSFMVFDMLEASEHVSWGVEDSVVFSSFRQDEGCVAAAQSERSVERDCREFVYLGELADEVGDLFEIEDEEHWWLNSE